MAYRDKTLDHRQRDSGAHRAAPAAGVASRVFPAGPDRNSAGCVLAQGRQIQRFRVDGCSRVCLLDGVDRRQWFGQAAEAAGGPGYVDSQRASSRWLALFSADASGTSRRSGLDRPYHRLDYVRLGRAPRKIAGGAAQVPVAPRPRWRLFLAPQVVDGYVLQSFLFYFVLLLVSFVLMTHVYTFFELLSDIVKNHITMSRVFTYLFFLTPQLSLRFGADQRAGGGADHFRHSHQAQRNHGIQGQRDQLVPSGGSGAGDDAVAERRPVCFRSLLRARRPIGSRTRSAKRSRASRCRPICIRTASGSSIRARTTIRRVFYYKYLGSGAKGDVGCRRSSSWIRPVSAFESISRRKKRAGSRRSRTWIFENGWSRDFRRQPREVHQLQRSGRHVQGNRRAVRTISCRKFCRISR